MSEKISLDSSDFLKLIFSPLGKIFFRHDASIYFFSDRSHIPVLRRRPKRTGKPCLNKLEYIKDFHYDRK